MRCVECSVSLSLSEQFWMLPWLLCNADTETITEKLSASCSRGGSADTVSGSYGEGPLDVPKA